MYSSTAVESATGSEELSNQATLLQSIVSKFKIKKRKDSFDELNSNESGFENERAKKTKNSSRPKISLSNFDMDFDKF